MAKSSAEIAAEIEQLKQQMADGVPYENSHAYRAARFDWLLNGKRDGLDAYQRTVDQAMQNKLQREATAAEGAANRANAMAIARMGKEQAAAERKAKEDEIKSLKAAQARPNYLEYQKKMLEAVDNGSLAEAEIYKANMEALEAEHGMKFGGDAQAMIDARVAAKALKEENAKKESKRKLNVANFTAQIPTTFKTEKAKTEWYNKVINNKDMTDNEKADEISRIRNIKSGKTKTRESAENAVAGYVGDKTKEALEEKDRIMGGMEQILKKIRTSRVLTPKQQKDYETAKKNGWI